VPGIDECLAKAMAIPGVLGASLVDWSSGLVLGTAGEGPNDDHEVAAVESTEVVRAVLDGVSFTAAQTGPGRPWPAADAQPVVPRAGRGGVPNPGQRAVLEAADGSRTPAQIAWLLGRSAFTTVLDVRRLAAAGYVETLTVVPRQAPSPPGTDPGTDIELLTRIRDALDARL
jgi:hypothetical protein